MANLPLTIRNLTSTPIELKRLERFDDASVSKSGVFGCITRTFGYFFAHHKSPPSADELAAKSESFTKHDVSIPIGPFETKITDIQPRGSEVLRLTFEAGGQRYRLDTPIHQGRSTVLTPLSPNPRYEFTAVHLPDASHLALYSSTHLESWMGKLRDEIPLSALSIPGTHNSATHHVALPSVRCQVVNVKEQLDNGVRFLDIRVQPESASDTSRDALILVHSAFPVSLTGTKYFRGLIDKIHSFLDANPTETVIISIKREGIGSATDQHLSKILKLHYATDDRWFTENRIPALGEVRGKVVLIRRFAIDKSLKKDNNGAGWAIDAESWPDNCADGICSSGEIRVQDFYEVTESMNIGKKITYSTDQLQRSQKTVCDLPGEYCTAPAEMPKYPFFINFLSASNFWRANCWPDRIAAKVNPSIIDHLCRKHNEPSIGKPIGDGSTGIVVCDWVGLGGDWDLVRCIVGMNAKLEMR